MLGKPIYLILIYECKKSFNVHAYISKSKE